MEGGAKESQKLLIDKRSKTERVGLLGDLGICKQSDAEKFLSIHVNLKCQGAGET